MKKSRKGASKEPDSVTHGNAAMDWTPLCKTTTRNRVQCPKPAEEREDFAKGKSSSIMNHGTEQMLRCATKIKLQLFPLDGNTCLGLEKEGYYPYLELTLSARKKISSVVKHINGKWGGSSIAVGEPFLVPYNISKESFSQRWMMNDTSISAGDVHEAVGRPATFRLRYGWFFYAEAKSIELPLSKLSKANLQDVDINQGKSACTEESQGKRRKIQKTSVELETITENDTVAEDVAVEASPTDFAELMGDAAENDGGTVQPLVPWDNIATNIICNQGDAAENDGGTVQPLVLWDDSATNISFGCLLSEASLQGELGCDPKSNGTNACLQPSQLVPDSFDAFIAAQLNHSQGPSLIPSASIPSILDSEDTRHAFSFQKISSARKDSPALCGSSPTNDDVDSKSRNQTTEMSVLSNFQKGHGCQASQTDQLLDSPICNDENTFGLSGIKWSDSLGPFDFVLSPSEQRLVMSRQQT